MDLSNMYQILGMEIACLFTFGMSFLYFLKRGKNNRIKINKAQECYDKNKEIIIQEIEDYPIIRCEDCHEIPTINFLMDKREIQITCEKERKTKNIPFETFFGEIKKYEDINLCQFCKIKNLSQKYYICKTCSNKILCQRCFEEHDKKDELLEFKIDSTCKKHYNKYEIYCPICKENKCSYCSIDHDEIHEKDEIYLNKKLFKKNKLEEFKNVINKISDSRYNIEQEIESVIQDLKEKIEFLN